MTEFDPFLSTTKQALEELRQPLIQIIGRLMSLQDLLLHEEDGFVDSPDFAILTEAQKEIVLLLGSRCPQVIKLIETRQEGIE